MRGVPGGVTSRAASILLLLGFLMDGGCVARPDPDPSIRPEPSPSSTAPSPTAAPLRGTPVPPTPTPIPSLPPLVSACPPRPFDDAVVLGPPFDGDIFVDDTSSKIAGQFLFGLATVYASPRASDPCELFTDRGLATAIAVDPRLRSALTGEASVTAELDLRLAYEGVYDLRVRPPTVPIDVVFDLPAGAATRDTATGEIETSDRLERVGLHLVFQYDGHHWRVDEAGPIGPEVADVAALPEPVPPGPPCTGFRHDPIGTRFDENDDRRWCDDGGAGREIASPSQVALLTRYPCGAHSAVLTIGRPLGAPLDRLDRWEYVRDPGGVFWANRWIAERWDGHAALPRAARETGWTNGNIDLWIDPAQLDDAVYVVRGGSTERWPRAADQWGVIDCN